MSQSFDKAAYEDAIRSKNYPAAIKLLERSTLPDRNIRIAKIKNRMAAAAATDELDTAKQYIKDGKYREARGLLATIDGDDALKLLARLEIIDPQKQKNAPAMPVYQGETPSFTNKLVIAVVLLFILFIPGLIALTIFAGEAKRYPDAPGAGALILLNRVVFWLFVATIVIAVIWLVAG